MQRNRATTTRNHMRNKFRSRRRRNRSKGRVTGFPGKDANASASEPRFDRRNRLSPPFGSVSPGNGSTFYAGCEVPRPWGLPPQTPPLAAGRLVGDGGKDSHHPRPKAVWWGGSQEQSAFGGPADAEPQRGPPPFFLTVRKLCYSEGFLRQTPQRRLTSFGV